MKKNGEYDPPKRGSLKKMCRIMKVTLLLLLITVYQSFGSVHAQQVKLDIDLENGSFAQFMEQVKRQSDFTFFFNDAMIMGLKDITLHVKQSDIETVLKACLKNTNISYRIKDNTIILFGADDKPKKDIVVKGKVVDESGEPLPGATVKVKEKAGDGKGLVRGTVTNVEGLFTVRVTDLKTMLEISFVGYETRMIAASDSVALKRVVLKEEMKSIEEVVVTGYQKIDRRLFTGAADIVKAEDAMVEGSNDISRMLQGKAAGVQIQNVSGTFGASPKLRVRGASSIYGNQKPLWVVDGLVLEDVVELSVDDLSSGDTETLISSAIAGLNADDIESFQILKDASATALYGARAMNGVVVITTKKGKKGTMKVNYSGEFTVRMKPSYSQFDIMDSQEQMMVYKEMEEKGWLNYADIMDYSSGGIYWKMANAIHSYDPETGFGLKNTPEAKAAFLQKYEMANTDWFDILFRNSLQQSHSVSLTSGSDRSKFYASFSYFNDGGWTVADKVNRYTANMNASFDVKKWVTLNLVSNASIRMQNAPGTTSRRTNAVSGTFERDFDINPFSYALNTSRAMRAYDDDGNYEYYKMNYTPFSILNELDHNRLKINMMDAKFQAEVEIRPFRGLEVKAMGAVRYVKTTREHRIHEQSNAAEAYRSASNAYIRKNNKFLYDDPERPGYPKEVVMPKGGFYNRNENDLLNYYHRAMVNYNTAFGDNVHTLNVMAGEEVRYSDRKSSYFNGFGYQWDRGGTPFIDYRVLKQQIENGVDFYGMSEKYDRFVAFFATAGYSYNDLYVFNVTGRYDGSNKLGKSRSARWLPTWNVSGAWHVYNEKFMQPIEQISRLTLRATYGLTASMGSSSNSLPVYYNETTFRPTQSDKENKIYISSLENSELTWEKQYELNVGMDLGLWDNRVSLTFDIYWRKGFDLIGNVRTSGIGGEVTKKANFADMKSNGLEFTLNTKNIDMKKFKWTSNLTFSYNKNEVTDLKSRPRVIDYVKSEGSPREGYPVRGIFSIPFMGLSDEGLPMSLNQNGDVVIGDVNFQETIKVNFLKYEGPVDPKFFGGFGNTFKYGNLSLNVFLNYQFGNKIRLHRYYRYDYSDLDAMPNEFSDRWILTGDEHKTNIPAILSRRQYKRPKNEYRVAYNAYNYSDVRVADGSFIRLKDISLSYSFPKRWVKSMGLSSVSLKGLVSNVALLYSDKKLNGQDPEFFRSGGVAMPVPRQVTFALKVGF